MQLLGKLEPVLAEVPGHVEDLEQEEAEQRRALEEVIQRDSSQQQQRRELVERARTQGTTDIPSCTLLRPCFAPCVCAGALLHATGGRQSAWQ